MEREPADPLEEFGSILTQISLENSELYRNAEKLVEVIQLELKHCLIPELANGQNLNFEWSDGLLNIFISIHVEAEDQFSYSIEISSKPKRD